MSTFEKIGTGIVAVAMITTLILPKRQTPAVLNAFFGGLQNWTGTAMGTK